MKSCLDTQHARTTPVMAGLGVEGWGEIDGTRPDTPVCKHIKDSLDQFNSQSTSTAKGLG